MTVELRKSIEKLRTLSPQLNKATDEARRVVQLVESFLNDECKLGLPCYVTVWSDMPDEGHPGFNPYVGTDEYAGLFLGYDRYSDKFRVVIATNEIEQIDDRKRVERTTKPWSDSTRAEKLQSFAKLPTLLESIVRATESAIRSAAEATAAIEEMNDAFLSVPEDIRLAALGGIIRASQGKE